MRACWLDTSPSSSTATLACTGSPSARRPRYSSSPTICRRVRAVSPGVFAFPDTSSTARSRCSPGDSGDCTCVSVWSRVSAIAVDSSTVAARGLYPAARPLLAGDAGEQRTRRRQRDAVAELARRVRAPAPDRAVGAARARVRAARDDRLDVRQAPRPARGRCWSRWCRCRAGRSRSRPSSSRCASSSIAQVCRAPAATARACAEPAHQPGQSSGAGSGAPSCPSALRPQHEDLAVRERAGVRGAGGDRLRRRGAVAQRDRGRATRARCPCRRRAGPRRRAPSTRSRRRRRARRCARRPRPATFGRPPSSSDGTGSGPPGSPRVPLPSWPSTLRPKQSTDAEMVAPTQVCEAPAATANTPSSPSGGPDR